MSTRAQTDVRAGCAPAARSGEVSAATPQERARLISEAPVGSWARALRGRGAAETSPDRAAARPRRIRRFAVVALAAAQLAWLDPHQKAREGNREFAAGKYDEAQARYNEGLVDQPDSALLHFNLGDAVYKQGKYDEALTAFQQVPAGNEDKPRAARVAYNIGNTKYKLGEAAESSEPQKALGLWAEALASYRRALGAAPDDLDAKVNHELVEKKIAELQKKLEEQKKEREEKQQQDQDQQDKQDQENKPEQQQGDQQQEQKPEDQQQDDAEKKEEQQKDEQAQEKKDQQPGAPQEQEAEAASEDGEKKDELSKEEAAALLDTQREQEVRPDEIVKKLQGAGVAVPAQDW